MAQVAKKKKKNKQSGSALDAVLEQKQEKIPYEVVEEEKLPGSRVRFKLKMTEENIKPRLENTFKDFNKYVKLPGFRPGHAPKALLKNRFDKEAREEMVKRMVNRLAELFSEDKGYEPVSQPVLLDWKSDPKEGTEVELAYEIQPEFEVKDENLNDLKVEAHKVKLDDNFVGRELERLQKQAATYEPTEEGYQPGDGMLLNCKVTDQDGNTIAERSVENHYSTNIEEEMPEAVAKELAGKKKGDTVSLDVEEDVEDVPGEKEKVHYDVEVFEVKRRILPELDDEFAKDVSDDYETLDDLKKATVEQAEEKEKGRQREEALEQVYNILRDRLEFDLPKALVQNASEQSISQMEQRLNQYGLSLRQMDQEIVKNYWEGVQAQSRVNVKNSLILKSLSKKFAKEPTEEQINEELERIAKQSGRKPLAVRAQLEAKKQWDQFIQDLTFKLANDELLDKAEVSYKEVSVDEFEEEMKKRQEEQAARLRGEQEQAAAEAAAESGLENAPESGEQGPEE